MHSVSMFTQTKPAKVSQASSASRTLPQGLPSGKSSRSGTKLSSPSGMKAQLWYLQTNRRTLPFSPSTNGLPRCWQTL